MLSPKIFTGHKIQWKNAKQKMQIKRPLPRTERRTVFHLRFSFLPSQPTNMFSARERIFFSTKMSQPAPTPDSGENAPGGFAHTGGKCLGRDDLRMSAPAQDPALHLGEA